MLVHVGRLAREKNLIFLLTACLRVLRLEPRAHLVIAGDGPIREQLETMAAQAGEAGERVHLLGARTGEELIDVYRAGDLFVFSSKTETQGMVVAEAMAAGVPAIALEASGLGDVVRDDVNGRLLAGDIDEEGFARAVVAALADRERREAWREGALRTARKMDMVLLAQKLHGHYASLKLLPNRQLKQELMSFGLLRNFFETVWEDLENWFTRI